MLSIETFTVGPLEENCYLLYDKNVSNEAILVDPGEESERLLEALENHNLNLAAIWLTHAHFDHVGALQAIHAKYPVPVLMHENETTNYENAADRAAFYGLNVQQPTAQTTPVTIPSTLNFAGLQVECLFTPGHSAGHVAYYFPDQNMLLSGDALFANSIGRTDLLGSNHTDLMNSIKTQILTLPDETKVYPGHGGTTNIGQERKHNPFLLGI